MQGLFEHLLLMTKGDIYTPKKSPVDLVPLMQELLDQVQSRFPQITLQCKYIHPQALVLHTDEILLRSILSNLLTNAYKHTSS
jgi:signal transduction histidine kinase